MQKSKLHTIKEELMSSILNQLDKKVLMKQEELNLQFKLIDLRLQINSFKKLRIPEPHKHLQIKQLITTL
jgi:hypothetical protein